MDIHETCEFPLDNVSNEEAHAILRKYKVVAVVGISRNTQKAAHFVPAFVQSQGYRIIPVNIVAEQNLLGEKTYKTLLDIPEKIDMVLVFRPSEEVFSIVEDAVKIGAQAVWTQEGIVKNSAAEYAKNHGLDMVMNKCMMKVLQSDKAH